jgi:hypothetical protein
MSKVAFETMRLSPLHRHVWMQQLATLRRTHAQQRGGPDQHHAIGQRLRIGWHLRRRQLQEVETETREMFRMKEEGSALYRIASRQRHRLEKLW